MKYEIVVEESTRSLENQVMWRLSKGWKLVGGVSVAIAYVDVQKTIRNVFVQAMCKENEEQK